MDSSRLGARRRLRHDATKTERKCADNYLHGGPKKTGPQTHNRNSVKSEPIYNFFSLENSLVNQQLNVY